MKMGGCIVIIFRLLVCAGCLLCALHGQPLDMSFMNITTVPAFSHLYQYINLDHNNITYIPPNAFSGQDILISLYLDGNSIMNISNKAFVGLPKLRYLYLEKNKLKQVPNVMPVNSTLRSLYLGYNEITVIRREDIEGLLQLGALTIEYNPLTTVPDINTILPSLKVGAGPFTCSRCIAYLKDVPHLRIFYDPPCTAPPHLVNVSWADITRQQLEDVDLGYCNLTALGKQYTAAL